MNINLNLLERNLGIILLFTQYFLHAEPKNLTTYQMLKMYHIVNNRAMLSNIKSTVKFSQMSSNVFEIAFFLMMINTTGNSLQTENRRYIPQHSLKNCVRKDTMFATFKISK